MDLALVHMANTKPTHPSENKITIDSFDFLKVLGRGSFGEVVMCQEKSTKSLCAMKILRKDDARNERNALTEHKVLRAATHPFLTTLMCSFQTKDLICFVMEYVEGGDLLFHLRTMKRFPEELAQFYAAEITTAIGYLHSKWIIHRDIKLENILLDRQGHVRLADYGLSKRNATLRPGCNGLCGTPDYMAPEVLCREQYGYAVDWWSFGVVMYRLMYGTLPFKGLKAKSSPADVLSKKPEFPIGLNWKATNFLRMLLIKDPSKRLGGGNQDVAEVMMHPFFEEINWLNLVQKKNPPPFQPQLQSQINVKCFDRFSDEGIKPPSSEESMKEDEDYRKLGFSFLDTKFNISK